MEEKLIEELFKRMEGEGFGEGTEQREICKRAIQFRTFSYKRSEEIEAGTTIDCSTLVSQAYWEGALIGVPFIAENQRTAASGKVVESVQDMIPADVLVKYPSLEQSPDKTYNHVGLYLGRDAMGEQWLIESVGGIGVRFSTVRSFDAQGGIKRFTLSTQSFTSTQAQQALSLAPFVPKFGRLGVRQYRKSDAQRPAHTGLDIYVPAGTPVYATISGIVSLAHREVEDVNGVEVRGECVVVRYLMLDHREVEIGGTFQQGDLLGYVALPSEKSDIIYFSVGGNESHLHLEVEDDGKYLNHLYLSKTGTLSLPFRL